MASAKTVVNYNGASHTCRPNSSQRRRKSSCNIRNNLLEAIYFFNPYSIQIVFKSRDNTLIGGRLVWSSYSAQTVTVRAL